MARAVDEDELIERWTLVGDELDLVTGRRGPTKLGFALLLKFYGEHGRFPRGRAELPDEAVGYVARQVQIPAADLGLYEWDGRTIKAHRGDIRRFFGFRECGVADADKATTWLAEHVCQSERRADRVREQLLVHLKSERIEPPTPDRLGRVIGSALRQAEQALTLQISGRIPADAVERMLALIAQTARPLTSINPTRVPHASLLTDAPTRRADRPAPGRAPSYGRRSCPDHRGGAWLGELGRSRPGDRGLATAAWRTTAATACPDSRPSTSPIGPPRQAIATARRPCRSIRTNNGPSTPGRRTSPYVR